MKRVLFIAAIVLMAIPVYAQRPVRGGTRGGTTTRPTTTVTSRPPATNSNDAARRKAINDFLSKTMALYEDGTSLTRSIYGKKVPYIIQGGEVFVLTPHTTTLGPGDKKESTLFIEDNNSIFPGILLWADQGLADGTPDPVTQLSRGTVDVMLDIDTGGDKFIVENVPIEFGRIQEAVATLVRQMYSSGYKQPARIQSATGDYSSTQEFAIKAGVDVNFAAKFSASMNTTSNSSSITHIDDFSQVYYNVVVQPHHNDWSYLFGEDVTAADIERVFNEKKHTPMVFVSQRCYGRRLYVLKEFRSQDFSMNVKASGSYSGVSATTDITSGSSSKESRKTVYIRGGDPSLGVGLIEDAGTVASVLRSLGDDALTMSQINQGVNMAYVTTYLGTKLECKRSTQGSYTTYDYNRALSSISVTFRNRCSHIAGGHIKLRIDYNVYTLDKDGNKVYYDTPRGCMQGYNRWIEHQDVWSKEVFELPLSKGEYADPIMHFQLRWKPSTQDWRNSETGKFEVKEVDGDAVIDFTINGYVGAKSGDSTTPYIHSTSFTKLQGFR